MFSRNPATILYDANGNPVSVVQDSSVYRIASYAKLQAGDETAGRFKITDGSNVVDVLDDSGIKRLRVSAKLAAGDNLFGKVQLVDSSGSNIASVSAAGRLAVDANVSTSPKGVVETYLANGASYEMNINGSGTPQAFQWQPTANHDVEIVSLSLIVEEPTISFGTTFFGATSLSNGLLIEMKAEDTTYTIANLQYTRDTVVWSAPGGFDLFAASPDMCRVYHAFPSGLLLKKSGTYVNPDYIRITVRDNISSLNYFRAWFVAVEIHT